jgi:hypothetical protein
MKIRDFQYPAFNSFKQRLAGFACVEVVFGLVVYIALVNQWIPQVILAAMFAPWVAISAAAFESLIDVPLLELRFDPENKDLHKPEFYAAKRMRKCWFLRVEVVNNGGRAAVDCEAKIRFPKAGRPTKDGKQCESPSKEFETWVGVAWAGISPSSVTIPPEGNAVANVTLMPEEAVLEEGIARSIPDSWGKFMSWVVTLDVARDYELGLYRRAQDGLCEATYGIELGVFSRNGFPIIKPYRLTISRTWENTSLERRMRTPESVVQ